MTTQTINDPNLIKKIKWRVFDFDDDDSRPYYNYDQAQTCCGVTEIGEIERGSFLKDIFVYSAENIDELWCEPKYRRHATLKEVVEAFGGDLLGGLAVCYLLPNQHNGDFGKLIRADNWTYHGSFWNPSSRNTLHHWSKVIHKSAPRAKKSKSAIPRKR